MGWKREIKPLAIFASVFALFYYLPLDSSRLSGSVMEALYLTKWYAREHVILCLIPAFFIAGAIAVFISKASVMKYLGAGANKFLSYGVASVSGSILAVCSCTVLPLFAGIYSMGAGLGPASAFLYAGPAVNVLAIVLTARVLGLELGIARAIGAIVFSIVIGLLMHLFFRREEQAKIEASQTMPEPEVARPLWQNVVYFAAMVAILVFANWGRPEQTSGLWYMIYSSKWVITAAVSVAFGVILVLWFGFVWWKLLAAAIVTAVPAVLFPDNPAIAFVIGVTALILTAASAKSESREWLTETWGFARQILPLLFFGVLVAGLLLGRPGHEGLIPAQWVSSSVGGNSLGANLFASVAGAFMYFATLTEVPILEGLLGSGMGRGPALALLLAGPALSLPNMLVIRSVMGTKKTVVFVLLVVVMATVTGMIYGTFSG